MVVNGAVTYVGQPDENGLFNATILVRKTWAKKNDNIKDNVVLRLGPFGLDKKCPKVKARMSYIFFIRNSGERKGKYRFYRVQLFPAYASESNLKKTGAILGEKPAGKNLYYHLSRDPQTLAPQTSYPKFYFKTRMKMKKKFPGLQKILNNILPRNRKS